VLHGRVPFPRYQPDGKDWDHKAVAVIRVETPCLAQGVEYRAVKEKLDDEKKNVHNQ